MAQSKLTTTTERLGTDAWGVTEIWSCLNAERATTEAYLWGRTPDVPGVPGGGRFSPHAIRVERTKNYRQGMTHLTAQYRTLSNDEYMERYPPKGVVLGFPGFRMENIKYDKNGVLVNGIDPTDPTGRTVYKIVRGPSSVRRPLMVYRIHAIVASKSIWIDQYTDKLGMVNSSWMGNLSRWGSNKRELVFSRLGFAPLPYDKSKFVVDYDFTWTGQRGLEWNKLSISRMFMRKVVRTPVLGNDGEATSAERDLYMRVPTTTWAYAPMYAEKNFSMVNNLCNW